MLFKSFNQNKFVYRQFHTSSPRHINPLIWVFLKPALKGIAWVTGRSTRKWYQQLPPEKQNIFIQHLSRHKYTYMGIFGTLGTALAVHYYTHLEEAPITGRRRYMLMNLEQLKYLSREETERMAAMYSNQMYASESKPTQLVAKIAKRLIQANMDIPELRTIKWTVRVIDTEMRNAFVLPSGDIYVTRGMMQMMTNEDQLAVVLAHELSHAILGHTAEKLSYSQSIDMIAIFGAFIIWSIFPSDWTSFWANFIYEGYITFTSRLPYSRYLEDEADEVGLQLAAKACYDIRESACFWESVDKADKQHEIPEFFSTHPASAKRVEHFDRIIPEALELRIKCKCAPLPEKKALGVLNLPKNPEEKVIQPLERRAGVLEHIPIIETTK